MAPCLFGVLQCSQESGIIGTAKSSLPLTRKRTLPLHNFQESRAPIQRHCTSVFVACKTSIIKKPLTCHLNFFNLADVFSHELGRPDLFLWDTTLGCSLLSLSITWCPWIALCKACWRPAMPKLFFCLSVSLCLLQCCSSLLFSFTFEFL